MASLVAVGAIVALVLVFVLLLWCGGRGSGQSGGGGKQQRVCGFAARRSLDHMDGFDEGAVPSRERSGRAFERTSAREKHDAAEQRAAEARAGKRSKRWADVLKRSIATRALGAGLREEQTDQTVCRV